MEQTDAACLCDEEPFSPIVDPAERLAGLPQWPGLSHNTRATADYNEHWVYQGLQRDLSDSKTDTILYSFSSPMILQHSYCTVADLVQVLDLKPV